MPGYEVSSLKKGLQILDLLKEQQRLNLTEISNRIEVNKSTVFRLLHTLEEMNYIIKLGRDYELHPMLFNDIQAVRRTIKWSKLQALGRLGAECGKDVFVGTLHGPDVIVRQVYEANTGQMVDRETSGSVPAYQTAVGKVILAQLERSEQLELFTASIDPQQITDQTFTDPDLFLRHLEVIKQQRYAADYEEFRKGVQCISSPVFSGNKVVASIAAADYSDFMPKHEMRSLTRKVIYAAEEITKEINTYVNSME